MEYLIIAILSYPLSYVFRGISTMIISKDLCKIGYIFSKRNIARTNMYYFDVIRYIPIFNAVLDACYLIEDVFDKRRVNAYMDSNYVVRMTNDEVESFKKDPSALNAYIINMRSLTGDNYKRKNAIVPQEMKIDDENIIYYNVDIFAKENGVSIVSVKGEISKYSNEVLNDIIETYYDELNKRIEEYVNTYYDGDFTRFKEELFDNSITDKIRNEIDITEVKNKVLKKYL